MQAGALTAVDLSEHKDELAPRRIVISDPHDVFLVQSCLKIAQIVHDVASADERLICGPGRVSSGNATIRTAVEGLLTAYDALCLQVRAEDARAVLQELLAQPFGGSPVPCEIQSS